MDEMIETQQVPDDVAVALRALRQVGPDEPDLDGSFRVGMAVAVLTSCRPPYPPPGESTGPAAAVGEVIEDADRALERALSVARTAEEAVRFGAARAALRGEVVTDFPW